MSIFSPFRDTKFFAIFLLLVAMTSIQVGASFAKQLFGSLGPLGTTSLRLILAAFILGIALRPWKNPMPQKSFKLIAAYGFSLGMMNFLFYMSLARIPLGIAVALEFIGPLGVSLYLSRKKRDFFWAILAALGIYLIVPDFNNAVNQGTSLDPLGILFALLAGAFWGAYIVFGKAASKNIKETQLAALGMIVAALVVAAPGVVDAGWKLLNPSFLIWGLLIALFSSALPYTFEIFALKKLDAKNFGILMSLEPALAAISGSIFLKEQLTLSQWSALALIMFASLGSSQNVGPEKALSKELL